MKRGSLVRNTATFHSVCCQSILLVLWFCASFEEWLRVRAGVGGSHVSHTCTYTWMNKIHILLNYIHILCFNLAVAHTKWIMRGSQIDIDFYKTFFMYSNGSIITIFAIIFFTLPHTPYVEDEQARPHQMLHA